jgi:hypothetical protein
MMSVVSVFVTIILLLWLVSLFLSESTEELERNLLGGLIVGVLFVFIFLLLLGGPLILIKHLIEGTEITFREDILMFFSFIGWVIVIIRINEALIGK